MDGLLLVDKPVGPTSHDVVARVRRALRERSIGHTGTLDPMASGVLPLVVGRATRLARFIGGDKTYDATIRLGVATDTCDALGTVLGTPFTGPWPASRDIDAALDRFRGTFLQQPPAFSAKKIAGQRSYTLARRTREKGAARDERPVLTASGQLADSGEPGECAELSQPGASREPGTPSESASRLPLPVSVTTHSIELRDARLGLVWLRVRCAAGFYVRSLAHDLGVVLGTGAHLSELRRVEAAGAAIEQAIALEQIQGEGGREAALAAMLPMDQMLTTLPRVALTTEGVAHVRVGRDLRPADATDGFAEALRAAEGAEGSHVRLFDPAGHLVAMAGAAQVRGLLHPAVVLM